MPLWSSFSVLEGEHWLVLYTNLINVCQIFLLFQSTEVTGWSRSLDDSRSAYTSLREHLLRYIENPDELGSALDPLDDDQHVSTS
jgi:TBC1 domain family protein 5